MRASARRPAPPAPVARRAALRVALDGGLEEAGWGLDEAARERLLDYLALLARWNRAYNLTAVRDPREMVPRHLLDSLSLLAWLGDGALLDVGTGAGLPGLVLAAARPRLRCVLLDASAKKTRFCTQVALELGLANVEVVRARIEAFAPPERFATVVSRAALSPARLWPHAARLLEAGGRLLAMTGPGGWAGELPAPPARRETLEVRVPGLARARTVTRIEAR